MRGWWKWTTWSVSLLVTIVLLLTIYSRVIHTGFQCVMFSMAALIYVELVGQYYAWRIELLGERDHRNAIHRLFSERLGFPVEPEVNEAINELSEQTQKARSQYHMNAVARCLLWLTIVGNLFRAAFLWT